MADTDTKTRRPAVPRQDTPYRITAAEIIAIVLSVMWIASVGLFFLFTSGDRPSVDSGNFVMTLIAIFMPVAVIWVAAATARASRVMREESARLNATIDAMRNTYMQQQYPGGLPRPTVEDKLDEIARAARKTETALATFTSIREPVEIHTRHLPPPASASAAATDDQPALALGTSAEDIAEPVSTPDFLRALNFPENGEDKEGFRALRRALHDRQIAQLITSAQDVLTLLAEEGIYMDDLVPDRARPEIWRRFAQGERGRAVAGLGGVRDRSSLALTAGRMRQDPTFRSAAHQFLRRFDKMLADFEPRANDSEIAQLSNTRTARAFMLLGRVTGVFA
ncbi:hypothetical protein [Psychromarinibacter sp. S121]|uniref:hypothetical protein n=1 Tax=Psychromarinibacter sp. S121 TaxID=3415127 RepID=UPI003C7E2E0E